MEAIFYLKLKKKKILRSIHLKQSIDRVMTKLTELILKHFNLPVFAKLMSLYPKLLISEFAFRYNL